MTEPLEKYIVEATFQTADEQEWDWLTTAFGATYCETAAQAIAIARFLSSHPAVELVEVLRQPPGQPLESIWCSDPAALQAARDRLARISKVADILGVDSPAFAEWLAMEKKGEHP
jgi:hypothetical protein